MINSSASENPQTHPHMAQHPEDEYNPYDTEWFEAIQRWTPRLLGIVPLFGLASSLFSQGGAQRGIPMALGSVLVIFLLVCFYIIISQMSQVWSKTGRPTPKQCLLIKEEEWRDKVNEIQPKLIRLICYQLSGIVFIGNPASGRTDLKQRLAFICKRFLLTLIQAPWKVPTPKKSSSSNEQAPAEPLLLRSSLLKRLADLSSSAKAFVLYLFQLRIQVGIAILSSVLFQTGQVNDVVLAIILDSDLKAYLMAIVFAVILSLLLWHTARYLTRIIPHLKKYRNNPSAISSGEGLFSYSFELFLFWISWVSLALFTTPIAKQAYGSMWGGNNYHIFVLLISQVIVIFLWRKFDYPKSTWGGGYRWWFVGLYIVGFMLPFLFQHLSANQIPEYVGSLGLLFWGLSMILVVASIIFRFSIVSGVPVLSLLLVGSYFININRINDNHVVRLMKNTPSKESLSKTRFQLPSLTSSFYMWLASTEAGEREPRYKKIIEVCKNTETETKDGSIVYDCNYPVYVVSAQGGGIYAAYHAAKTLHTITKSIPEFRNHLFAISSVSGGSIGSAIYVNSLSCGKSGVVDEFFDKPRDPLAMIVASMLFGDLVQRFYPFPVPAWDRSLGLELAFEPNKSEKNGNCINLNQSFYETQLPFNPTTGPLPFLVLNTTEVDNGRRYLFSPFRINSRFSDAEFHEPWSNPPEQIYDLDLRYSTAAGLSARFPLVSPYGYFPEQKLRRFIDGGLYDNSGAITAKEIKDELIELLGNPEASEQARSDCRGKNNIDETICKEIYELLIKRPFYLSSIAILDAKAVDLNSNYASSDRQQGFTFFGWTALTAVFTTRESRVAKAVDFFSYDGAGKNMANKANLRVLITKDFFLGGSRRPLLSIPLGWKLSCQARSFINDQLQPPDPVISNIERNYKAINPKVGQSPHSPIPCEVSSDPLLKREPLRFIPPYNLNIDIPKDPAWSFQNIFVRIRNDLVKFRKNPS